MALAHNRQDCHLIQMARTINRAKVATRQSRWAQIAELCQEIADQSDPEVCIQNDPLPELRLKVKLLIRIQAGTGEG